MFFEKEGNTERDRPGMFWSNYVKKIYTKFIFRN